MVFLSFNTKYRLVSFVPTRGDRLGLKQKTPELALRRQVAWVEQPLRDSGLQVPDSLSPSKRHKAAY